MSTSIVGTEALNAISDVLGDKYYYPFSGKIFKFIRASYMDIMRLSDQNIKIISELNKDWKNILKYDFNTSIYDGKIPNSFKREGCFYINFEDFALCCYIDIEDLEGKTCAVFDVVQYID